MLEIIIILGLIAYTGWQRYTYRRNIDRILVHAAGMQAEITRLKLEAEQ